MDDFYNEMKPTLQDIETSNFKLETNILQEYFTNVFIEALVPDNSRPYY
jgi:hypothetical protein